MGADAFATDNHTVFKGNPDKHTAAHEAAHLLQEKSAGSLADGVGQVGDRYEQHADAVADRVVRGESAEDLLATMAPSGGGSIDSAATSSTVQRKVVYPSGKELTADHLGKLRGIDKKEGYAGFKGWLEEMISSDVEWDWSQVLINLGIDSSLVKLVQPAATTPALTGALEPPQSAEELPDLSATAAVRLLIQAGHTQAITLKEFQELLAAACRGRYQMLPKASIRGAWTAFATEIEGDGKTKTRGAAAAANLPGAAAAAPVPAPAGYQLLTNIEGTAYVKDNGFKLGNVGEGHLVRGANSATRDGWHQSGRIKGANATDYYLHPSKKDPTLYLLGANPGPHVDGILMVDVVKQGTVNDGMHRF